MQSVPKSQKTDPMRTQLEFILRRPDMFIGSTQKTKKLLWILEESKGKFNEKEIEFIPSLYKIFDEILLNAVNDYQKTVKIVKVKIDEEKNLISIWNDGKGMPVEINPENNLYYPELVFGPHSFDNPHKKANEALGVKLANMFSKKFIVETGDSKNQKYFIFFDLEYLIDFLDY